MRGEAFRAGAVCVVGGGILSVEAWWTEPSGGGGGARGPSVRSLIFILFLKYKLLTLSADEVTHIINAECVCVKRVMLPKVSI